MLHSHHSIALCVVHVCPCVLMGMWAFVTCCPTDWGKQQAVKIRRHLFQQILAEAETVSEMNWEGRRSQGWDQCTVAPIWGFLIVFLCNNTGKLNDMWLQFVKKTWGLLQIRHAAALPRLCHVNISGLGLWQGDRKRKWGEKKQRRKKKVKHSDGFPYFVVYFCFCLQIMEVSQSVFFFALFATAGDNWTKKKKKTI